MAGRDIVEVVGLLMLLGALLVVGSRATQALADRVTRVVG